MTREDSLKTKNSAPACEKMRRITKNCKDKLHSQTLQSIPRSQIDLLGEKLINCYIKRQT